MNAAHNNGNQLHEHLKSPTSLAVCDTYTDAQFLVDYLSDQAFPVQHVIVVGTDLKQVERVTGRLTVGRVLSGGALSGMWLGLFVGGVMWFVTSSAASVQHLMTTVLIGAVFGMVWAGLGYSLTRGRRDFTSVTQVVATRYEVLVEGELRHKACELMEQSDHLRRYCAPPEAPAPTPKYATYGEAQEAARRAEAEAKNNPPPKAGE